METGPVEMRPGKENLTITKFRKLYINFGTFQSAIIPSAIFAEGEDLFSGYCDYIPPKDFFYGEVISRAAQANIMARFALTRHNIRHSVY